MSRKKASSFFLSAIIYLLQPSYMSQAGICRKFLCLGSRAQSLGRLITVESLVYHRVTWRHFLTSYLRNFSSFEGYFQKSHLWWGGQFDRLSRIIWVFRWSKVSFWFFLQPGSTCALEQDPLARRQGTRDPKSRRIWSVRRKVLFTASAWFALFLFL